MAAAGELVLGLNAVTAVNTSGDSSAPVWVIVTEMKDETLNMETALSDVTTRAANGWRLQVGTLSEASVDAQMLYKASADPPGSGTDVLIRDAFLSKSRVLMGFFDDDPASAAADNVVSGLIGGFSVTNYSIGRQLEEAMMIDTTFTVREDDTGAGPTWDVDNGTP